MLSNHIHDKAMSARVNGVLSTTPAVVTSRCCTNTAIEMWTLQSYTYSLEVRPETFSSWDAPLHFGRGTFMPKSESNVFCFVDDKHLIVLVLHFFELSLI